MHLLGSTPVVALAAFAFLSFPANPSRAEDPQGAKAAFAVPAFRQVDATERPPSAKEVGTVRFLADAEFPPFSYRDDQGTLTGFNVALADALCTELRLACEFIVKPWDEVEAALLKREGDAVLSGTRMTEAGLAKMSFTRPFLRTLGRFAVTAANESLTADPRGLAGKRVGVMAKSAHEVFLEENFGRSTIRPFDTEDAAREALKTGGIDALFDDGFRLMFWLASADAEDCCRFAQGSYLDPRTVSRPIAIGVRSEDQALRRVLDYGLDRLQSEGTFATVYRRFFPMSVW
ncbi:MAG: transporter substrate-binding domain-containing protein [Parvibaculaceae bacterium]